ncbi:hypothetical protein V8F06_001742 [Rhypophila decipiens]
MPVDFNGLPANSTSTAGRLFERHPPSPQHSGTVKYRAQDLQFLGARRTPPYTFQVVDKEKGRALLRARTPSRNPEATLTRLRSYAQRRGKTRNTIHTWAYGSGEVTIRPRFPIVQQVEDSFERQQQCIRSARLFAEASAEIGLYGIDNGSTSPGDQPVQRRAGARFRKFDKFLDLYPENSPAPKDERSYETTRQATSPETPNGSSTAHD